MARIDVEWVAFTAGLKPAVRRTVDPARVAEVEARMRADGAAVCRAEAPAILGGRLVEVLYASHDLIAAQVLRDEESTVLPGRGSSSPDDAGRHRAVGRALGFPPCCVEAFVGRLVRGVDRLREGGPGGFAEDYVALRETWVPRPDARVNPFLMRAQAQLVSFYPCRLDCSAAVVLATAVLAAVGRRDPAAARALGATLGRAVVLDPAGARAQVILDAHGVVVRAAAPSLEGRAEARDEDFARSLSGTRVGPEGAVHGPFTMAEPPWCADFAWTDVTRA